MINPGAVGNNAYDLLDGNIREFYDSVDQAIVESEVIKGQYRLTCSPSYNSPTPVQQNSFTTIAISPSGPAVVDLENSFICANAILELRTNLEKPDEATTGSSPTANYNLDTYYAFYWKHAIECLERYEIMVNSTTIYTQSFCGEESFICDQIFVEQVRNTQPYTISSWDNVSHMDPNICGSYVKMNGVEAHKDFYVKIKIRIPLASFLFLKNIKYLMSWMGKWEIKLWYKTQNLCVAPIDPFVVLNTCPNYIPHMYVPLKYKDSKTTNEQKPTWGSTQLEDTFMGIKNISNLKASSTVITIQTEDEMINAYDMKVHNTEANLATFQLRPDINESIRQRYANGRPLTFPISNIQISRFTGNPTIGTLNTVLCQAINNCDTMFILVPFTPNQHTCFFNPYLKQWQVAVGNFGMYPTQPMDTYDDPRFINFVQDSLNVNMSPISSLNKDTAASFEGDFRYRDVLKSQTWDTADDDLNNQTITPIPYKDKSNFFIPIPFSIDDDYQGGLSSPMSNINFRMTASHNGIRFKTAYGVDSDGYFKTPFVAAFLIDSSIMLKPDPVGDGCRVFWSDRTLV